MNEAEHLVETQRWLRYARENLKGKDEKVSALLTQLASCHTRHDQYTGSPRGLLLGAQASRLLPERGGTLALPGTVYWRRTCEMDL